MFSAEPLQDRTRQEIATESAGTTTTPFERTQSLDFSVETDLDSLGQENSNVLAKNDSIKFQTIKQSFKINIPKDSPEVSLKDDIQSYVIIVGFPISICFNLILLIIVFRIQWQITQDASESRAQNCQTNWIPGKADREEWYNLV